MSSADLFSINFEQSSYEVLEDVALDNFALLVCIRISDLIKGRTVRLTTVSGTAQGNQYYSIVCILLKHGAEEIMAFEQPQVCGHSLRTTRAIESHNSKANML